MLRFCNACRRENPKMRCTGCKTAYYCNSTCQASDWTLHKQLCKAKGTAEERQTKAIQDGNLHFRFLNPRQDRSVALDANDTANVFEITPGCRQLLERMHLDPKGCRMMRVDSTVLLPYGRCVQNVRCVVKKHGGKILFGWCLYEGKLAVEAEFHAVWESPDGKTIANVTANSCNLPYCGMFITDPAIENVVQAPSNVVFWK
jgi:hypothetical protein